MPKQYTITCTCGTVFMGNRNRKFCDRCRNRSLMARSKQAPIDLSPEEIERRFLIARTQVRRDGVHQMELGMNMQWRYSG